MMSQLELFPTTTIEWSACVHSTLNFGPDTPLWEIYDSLLDQDSRSCAAIVECGRPIGVISRARLADLLESNHGHVLYGKRPAREYMSSVFRICDEMDAKEALIAALARPVPQFFDDVMYVTLEGEFRGLISVRALVKIQSQLVAIMEARIVAGVKSA